LEDILEDTGIGFRCEKCNISFKSHFRYYKEHEKTYVHMLSEEEHKIKVSEFGKNSVLKGVATEQYFLDILKTLDYDDIKFEGNFSNMFNVFVKFKDEKHYHGIQIKTMSSCGENAFKITCKRPDQYFDDTLIIATNNERDAFALYFFEDTGHKDIRMSLTHNMDKLCPSIDIFKDRIFEMSRRSTIVKLEEIDTHLCPTNFQEKQNINRLSEKLKTYGMRFEKHINNSTTIDGTINGYNVQLKTSRRKVLSSFIFGMHKLSGKKMVPYDEKDNIDYFIFEIAIEGYMSNFYIIHTDILKKLNYISTSKNTGKKCIALQPYDDIKDEWISSCFNNFESLTAPKTENMINKSINIVINDLHRKCIEFNLECEFENMTKIKSINSHRIIHLICHEYTKKMCGMFSISESSRIIDSSGQRKIDFIVFEFGGYLLPDFCIIPVHIYLEKHTKNGKLGQRISIPSKMSLEKDWTTEYVNQFEQFKEKMDIKKYEEKKINGDTLYQKCIKLGLEFKMNNQRNIYNISSYRIMHIYKCDYSEGYGVFQLRNTSTSKITKDLDFIIFEFTDPYSGNFCIIPTQDYVDNNSEGKRIKRLISIPPPNFLKKNWTSSDKYMNNFTEFIKKKNNPSQLETIQLLENNIMEDIKNMETLEEICIKNGWNFTKNRRSNINSINSYKIIYIPSPSKYNKPMETKRFRISDSSLVLKTDFIIFPFEHKNLRSFYIIPREDYKKNNTENGKIVGSISVPLPESKKEHWIIKGNYMNNFEPLKVVKSD
jgi:hypothetical protein